VLLMSTFGVEPPATPLIRKFLTQSVKAELGGGRATTAGAEKEFRSATIDAPESSAGDETDDSAGVDGSTEAVSPFAFEDGAEGATEGALPPALVAGTTDWRAAGASGGGPSVKKINATARSARTPAPPRTNSRFHAGLPGETAAFTAASGTAALGAALFIPGGGGNFGAEGGGGKEATDGSAAATESVSGVGSGAGMGVLSMEGVAAAEFSRGFSATFGRATRLSAAGAACAGEGAEAVESAGCPATPSSASLGFNRSFAGGSSLMRTPWRILPSAGNKKMGGSEA
jgi:hypothetical protein